VSPNPQPRPISHGAAAAIALDRSLDWSIESRISVCLAFSATEESPEFGGNQSINGVLTS
jgi:hypothetical protein